MSIKTINVGGIIVWEHPPMGKMDFEDLSKIFDRKLFKLINVESLDGYLSILFNEDYDIDLSIFNNKDITFTIIDDEDYFIYNEIDEKNICIIKSDYIIFR